MKKFYIFPAMLFLLFSCSSIRIEENFIEKNISDEITIIQISDLHLNKNRKIYKNLINMVNKISPDLLLFTGDSIDKKENLTLLNTFLMQIDPKIAKYSVLGNWEHWCNINFNDLITVYSANNVEPLINSSSEITIKGQKLYIYGTDDFTAGNPDLSNMEIDDDKINIIMTHSPVYFDNITKFFGDKEIYVFSGHTHGGQVTFFGKPFFLPQGCGKYLKGIYKKGNCTLYVSKGIGNSSHDIRLFAKPDIFMITIR
ncbi:MAG: metallophosphoesterase [bacterium]|nr:metallophosphoesterase [bacterium]